MTDLPQFAPDAPLPATRRPWLSPLNQRRWRNFRSNGRAFWSLVIFGVLFVLSLFAELLANERPIVVRFQGEFYFPLTNFYSERTFGGFAATGVDYFSEDFDCLVRTGGAPLCTEDPAAALAEAEEFGSVEGQAIRPGWAIWPPIRYSYRNSSNIPGPAPAPPSAEHWLGTDPTGRDVLARVIYGFRLSVGFALVVAFTTSVIGIAAGAIQGYFGGLTDLLFQRIIEIWGATPQLYIIILMAALFQMDFWLLVFLMTLFGWTALVGVVRAEFLRARNFEYVRAARALGVSDAKIMFRHILPNAMVATLTMLPFIVTGTIGGLAALDYLGFGLPPAYPSLGTLTLQAQQNLHAPWLGFTAFFTFVVMLSLLVFIFEGVRDAFDPRKTFR